MSLTRVVKAGDVSVAGIVDSNVKARCKRSTSSVALSFSLVLDGWVPGLVEPAAGLVPLPGSVPVAGFVVDEPVPPAGLLPLPGSVLLPGFVVGEAVESEGLVAGLVVGDAVPAIAALISFARASTSERAGATFVFNFSSIDAIFVRTAVRCSVTASVSRVFNARWSISVM
jgi:hypothetical protein